jgi:2-amino-4-hydroxy-6-hydroxymethyldihydropteridine diphosphokinase
MAQIFLALGSNLGNRKQNLEKALNYIAEKVTIDMLSPVYESDPIGYTEQPLFLNAVLGGTTVLKPLELLKFIKDIEQKMGRQSSFPNAPRLIDIDVLFYDAKMINKPELTIPHPRLTIRAFVMVPLADLAPELVHPGNNRPVKTLLEDLGKISGLRRWCEADEIWQRS